jgi:uncharacterized protein
LPPYGSPFWKTKTLPELTRREWESLCDGCGLCCLQKLEDKKTGRIDYTNVSCYLLDIERCCCRAYEDRESLVKECLQLTPAKVAAFRWLPLTCAYRRVACGQDLLWWHPLVSGDPETVHLAGISARKRAISEEFVHPDDIDDFIVRGLVK